MQPPMQMEPMAPMQPMEPVALQAPTEPLTFEPMKIGAVGEFIPKGKIVAQSKEQFPDLGDAFGDEPVQKKAGKKGKKGKKGGMVVVSSAPVVKVEEDVDESLPWKGKPSSFFLMNPAKEPSNDPANPMNMEMNDEQWKFIFKYYPEYGSAPYEIITWLYGQVKMQEDMIEMQYAKPVNGGIGAGEDDDYEANNSLDNKYDKGFGPKSQSSKQQQKVQTDKIKEAQLKRL